jgi:Ca-activated chloride channel family protein
MKKILAALVVVGLASVGVVTVFGDNFKSLHGMSADALAGDTAVEKRSSRSQGKLEKKLLTDFAAANGGDRITTTEPSYSPAPNSTTRTVLDSLSTFGIDVDTASYTWARRALMSENALPTPSGVRVEEWVNAFDYAQQAPVGRPFAVAVEGAISPFDETKTLVKVALKGRVVAEGDRMPTHLVFLVDVSGSMSSEDRLPLAKRALTVLTRQLDERDTVSVVTYAGSTQVVLEPTNATQQAKILSAVGSLQPGGGTSMGSGMELAYKLAVRQVKRGTTTRVIVLTDGDTNIGPNLTPDAMLSSIHRYVEEGVTMTTVGFGMGNYKGGALEQLADKGNGQALYIDGEAAIDREFRQKLTGNLQVIAKDVKVQVHFDPKVVSSYRLIGYENRDIADADFRNDKVDSGELGSGHSVTALYEVALTSTAGALGSVAVRGLLPESGEAFEIEEPMTRASVSHSLPEMNADYRFATAVVLGADTLRGNVSGSWSLAAIARLAEEASNEKPERLEFVEMMRKADAIKGGRVARVIYTNAY